MTPAARGVSASRFDRSATQRDGDGKSEWPRNIRSREIHHHIRARIGEALGGRSWNWLAHESGVPQSTLAQQSSRPKFSVEVLWRISRALDVDFGYLLPGGPESDKEDEDMREALHRISEIAKRAVP